MGQVVAIEEKEVEINYMKKTGSSFIWPIVEDAAWTSRDTIHLFSSIPEIDRQQFLTFNDLDQKICLTAVNEQLMHIIVSVKPVCAL